MKGLTPNQLVEITEFVQKHHEFGYVKEADRINGHLGYCIKYIDACYDSRQGDYWAITFRGMGRVIFSTNAFGVFNEKPNDFPYTSLHEWIMAFLKYEWKQGDRQFDFMSDEIKGKLTNPFPNGVIEKEWSDIDMMNAYCGDLEGGATSEDMANACKWIIGYKETQNKQCPTP